MAGGLQILGAVTKHAHMLHDPVMGQKHKQPGELIQKGLAL